MEINGARFDLITEPEWRIPEKDSKLGTGVLMTLRITNVSDAPQAYYLFDTTHVALEDGNGNRLMRSGGRDRTKPGRTISPLIAAGESYDVELPANLVWAQQGSVLRLEGSDGFGGRWHFDGLKAGKYLVSIIYESLASATSATQGVWVGKAVRERAITLR